MVKKAVKVRVFSDRPIDINIIWFVIVILLVTLSAFLGYKVLSQECPDVTCQKCQECPEIPDCKPDCDSCPPKIEQVVTETIKYKCMGKDLIADNPDDCTPKVSDITPNTKNEEDTFINEVDVYSSCINNNIGGTVYFDNGVIADNITIQIKEPGQNYEPVLNFKGLFKGHKYFGICEPEDASCKRSVGDFTLEKYKRYILRLDFDLTSSYGSHQYSNEHLIETTSTSDYVTKKCSLS